MIIILARYTLHAKESHTRSTIDRYYKLKAEIPKILDKANDQNDQLLAALCKHNIAIKKDEHFVSDQTNLNNKMESLEDKFSELSEKLEKADVIAKPVAVAPHAPSPDVSEVIKLLSKQISDAQVVTNKHISDSQKELAETLKSCNKSKLKRVQPIFFPKRNLEDYSLFRQFKKDFEHYISDVSNDNWPDKCRWLMQ